MAVLLVAGMPGLSAAAQVELVSRTPWRRAPETAGGGLPGRASLSADGRFFVYASSAANLVSGQVDANAGSDVFLYDRLQGTTALVSHAAGSSTRAAVTPSQDPVISADGGYIAFASSARDLTAGLEDSEGRQVFLYERATGKVTLVSRRAGSTEAADAPSDIPFLSADGSYVGFTSAASDLLPGPLDGDASANVYLYERTSGTTILVSRRGSAAQQTGNGSAGLSAMSADGRFLAFISDATDHVAGQNDPNGALDVFLFDRLAGAATLVSHQAGSALTAGKASSVSPTLSADGRYVAFASKATDLVPGVSDGNGQQDVFLYDRLMGTVSLVSRSAGSPNAASPNGGGAPVISEDGSAIAYYDGERESSPQEVQLLVFDRLSGDTALVAPSPGPVFTPPAPGQDAFALSGNGRYVVFTSLARNLAPGQDDPAETRDVFLHDRATGATVLVSHTDSLPGQAARGQSLVPAISADGSWIAFASDAGDLVAGKRDSNGVLDLFLHETATAASRIVTLHPPGMASLSPLSPSGMPSISGDGRYVAFASLAAGLFIGHADVNGVSDVFLYDRVTKTTVLVSRTIGFPSRSANDASEAPIISRDGNYVLFTSRATNLVAGLHDALATPDVFLFDRRTGTVVLVSRSTFPDNTASGTSIAGGLSADGSVVVFTSLATDLVPQKDENGIYDVFWFDRRTGKVHLVSRTGNRAGRTGNGSSFFSSMSPDGAFIAFDSAASDLVPGAVDANGAGDAFVYQRSTGKISLLSRTRGTSGPAASGEQPAISAKGRYAAFLSPIGSRDVVLLDRSSGKVFQAGPHARPGAAPALSDDGRYVLFSSSGTNVIPGQNDLNDHPDLFLFDRVSGERRLVSHVPGSPLRTGGQGAFSGRLSADGRYVVFTSQAPELLPPGSAIVPHVFRYDRTFGEAALVTRSLLSPERAANSFSQDPVVSASGGFVAFVSFASDLVNRDFGGTRDVFLYVP
ncbi:MAG TPA: hypothetical protein VKK31_21400 [Thermoanaerobaculia bacterium]|nr:hypothetical protein [Thermoanaerobaculia bacterium]